MTDEAKEKVWSQILEQGATDLSGDERMQLEKLMSIPLLHKVFGTIYVMSNSQAAQLLTIDFSDLKEAHRASRIQGNITAAVGLINTIMDLTDAEEETDDN